MVDLAAVTRLVDVHAAQRARIAAAATTRTTAQVRAFDRWYDTAAITALVSRVVPPVEAAQRQTASLTDAYLQRVLALLLGRRLVPVGPVPVGGLRRGVTLPEVYGRLADQFRYEVSQGTDEATALEHVVTRASVLTETDLDLAFRAQAQAVLAAADVRGYRRVVRPELSAGGTCGLCIAASDRVYRKAELMPLHARCKCDVLPIVGQADPGRTLNGQDLAALYKRAGSTASSDLKRVRFTAQEHGELGPQLRVKGQAFRGPEDLAA